MESESTQLELFHSLSNGSMDTGSGASDLPFPAGKSCYHSCYQEFPAEEEATEMGGMLVRNVPHDVRQWIEKERQRSQVSQQEFVLSVLHRASLSETAPLLLPFNEPPKEPAVPDALPLNFFDLFAGIGGFRSALSKLGGTCVFSCEWDRYSQKTYKAWWGDTPHGDITKIVAADIPDQDFLAAGLPCQSFPHDVEQFAVCYPLDRQKALAWLVVNGPAKN
jgi:hypothetical protein